MYIFCDRCLWDVKNIISYLLRLVIAVLYMFLKSFNDYWLTGDKFVPPHHHLSWKENLSNVMNFNFKGLFIKWIVTRKRASNYQQSGLFPSVRELAIESPRRVYHTSSMTINWKKGKWRKLKDFFISKTIIFSFTRNLSNVTEGSNAVHNNCYYAAFGWNEKFRNTEITFYPKKS